MVFLSIKAFRNVGAQILGAVTVSLLLSCGGLSGGPTGGAVGGVENRAASSDSGVASGSAVPGFPSGEIGTKFDPDGTREYGFVEERRHFTRGTQNDYATELEGHVDHLEKTAGSGEKFDSVPCCEGRWLLARDTQHQTCALAPIGAAGSVKVTIPAGDPLVPELLFYLSKIGYAPDATVANSTDCASVSWSDFLEFPIGYVRVPQDPIQRTVGPAKPSEGDGIRTLKQDTVLPSFKTLDSTDLPGIRRHFPLPQDSDDSDLPVAK